MKKSKRISRERGAQWEPTVKFRSDKNRWMVDCGLKFLPRRTFYVTQEAANDFAKTKHDEFLNRLSDAKQESKNKTFLRFTDLPPSQLRDIGVALGLVDQDSTKLIRAVRFYLAHHGKAGISRKLIDVYNEFVAGKETSGRRHRTIVSIKGRLAPFIEDFKESSINDITTNDIEGWLNKQGFRPSTRNVRRVAIGGLFGHALKRDYLEHNPVDAIEQLSVDQSLPIIHSVDNVRGILVAAASFVPTRTTILERGKNRKAVKWKTTPESDPLKIQKARSKIVPYLAIGYFCGLRPENELVNLNWRDVHFDRMTIRVDPATAKKRRQRYVDISPNLVQWLSPFRRDEGRIGFSRKYFKTVKEESGVQWSNDVMRHSFGSYHLAYHENAAKTSLQMGHISTEILFNNYRNLVTKKDAEAYWHISPVAKPD